MEDRIAPHVRELSRALGNTDEDIIRLELEKLLSFKVPLDEAKKTIMSKYKSKVASPVLIKDLKTGMEGIEIVARILSIEEKIVISQGEKKIIFSGTMGDGTGICSFTCWDDMSIGVGDVLKINNAYTRLWNNRPELYFGKRSTLEKLPDEHFQGIEEMSHTSLKKLKDIVSADVITGSKVVIIEMYHRDVSLKGKNLTVIEGVIADETGKLPFTSWKKLAGIDIGSFVRFEGAAVRIFRGLPSISFNEDTSVDTIDDPYELPFSLESASMVPDPMPMSDVVESNGIFDVLVRGNIISIRPGSGMIERCPVCNRVTQKSNCRAHGNVDCIRDMRIKAILDDGTGSIHLMLNCELSEAIYGKSIYEAEKMVLDSISKDVVFEDMKRTLTGKYIAARGNSSKNELGVSIVAKSAWYPENDLPERIDSLLERLGEGGGY
ncbi:Single-stranded DNA binding protein [Methanolobus sp. ZRKC3]|uniref:Single-stranded DNA binding protein n=1 Tax=Methanolobus sp. ZRKC3 TaxID=3125786 RepID=UPI00324411FB